MSPWILLIWIPFLLLISGFPDQWTGEGGLLNDDRIKLHEEEGARIMAKIEKKKNKELRPTHKARRLHDGIPSSKRDNVPIEELMEGFRGVL
jgi:hypothetical protein